MAPNAIKDPDRDFPRSPRYRIMGAFSCFTPMNTYIPRRVLIIRLSAIGDIVMASGLISALRVLWPEAHLAWLAEKGPAELLKHNNQLDQVIELPRQRWKAMGREGRRLAAWSQMRETARALRAESFDLVLDLQGLLKSGIWAWATAAPRRIGLGSREGSQWLMTETFKRNETDPRMGKEYRALAVHLGAAESDFRAHLAIPTAISQRAETLIKRHCPEGTKTALLAPFTTRQQKHWFDEEWIVLSEHLHQAGFQCLILGGPADVPHADVLIQTGNSSLISLAGQTSLLESAALIKNVQVLIGVDTGLTHMGMALGTPTVALFGSTLPYWDTGRSTAEILYTREPCSPCHRRPTCQDKFTCMRHHHASNVMASVLRVTASPALTDEPHITP